MKVINLMTLSVLATCKYLFFWYLIFIFVFKIFKVSEKLVIHDIRHFLELHDVASLCEMRCMKFLNKTRTLTHATLQSLMRQFY